MYNVADLIEEIYDYEQFIAEDKKEIAEIRSFISDAESKINDIAHDQLYNKDAKYRVRHDAIKKLRPVIDALEQNYSSYAYLVDSGGEETEFVSRYPETEEVLKPLVSSVNKTINDFRVENFREKTELIEKLKKELLEEKKADLKRKEQNLAAFEKKVDELYASLKYDSSIFVSGTFIDGLTKRMTEIDPRYKPDARISVDIDGSVHVPGKIEVTLTDVCDYDDWVMDLEDIFSEDEFDSQIEDSVEELRKELNRSFGYEFSIECGLDKENIDYIGERVLHLPDYDPDTGYGSETEELVYVGDVSAIGHETVDIVLRPISRGA